MRRAPLPLLLVLIILGGPACDDDDAAADPPPVEPAAPTCADIEGSADDLATEEALRALLMTVQATLVPELDGVPIDLATMEAESDFFVANLDFSTISNPPRERHYLVRYNPRIHESPPPFEAVVAILVHELKHVLDYTGMETQEFLDFGLEVLTGDASAYERATDEFSLERGCAEGLKAYRVWLYARIDAEAEAQKRYDYYTPEEIDAWVAAQGE